MNFKRKSGPASKQRPSFSKRPRMASRPSGDDDESVTSEDEVRSPVHAESDGEQDDFFEETADEKRVRLAKAYLAEVGERVHSDADSSEDSDEDLVDAALRRDLAVQQQRVKHVVTGSLAVQSTTFIRCHGNSVTAVRVCPFEESLLASVGKDGKLTIFSDISGQFVRKFEVKIDTLALYAVVWLSSSRLAVAGESKTIFLVSLVSGEAPAVTGRLRSHQGRVTGLAWVPDTSSDQPTGPKHGRLVSVGADKAVKQWLLSETGGSYLESYFGHTGDVLGVAVLADSIASPVTCGYDNSCRVWNLEKDSHKVFPGISDSGDCVAAVDAKHFIAGTSDGHVLLHGMSYRKPMHVFLPPDSPGWTTAVGALRNSDLAAFGGKGVLRLLKVAAPSAETTKKRKMEITLFGEDICVAGVVNDLSFANSGRLLVAAVGRDHRLGRWLTDPKGKNGIFVIRLTHQNSDLPNQPTM